MIPDRRRWLHAAAALVVAHPLAAYAQAESAPAPQNPQQRWPTGNRRLAPLTLVGEQLLYAGDQTQGLIHATRATTLWQHAHTLPGGLFRPRCDRTAGVALFATAGGLLARQLADGEPLWRSPPHRQFGVPLLADGAVLLGDGHELLKLDLATGKELWRFAAIAETQISYAPACARDSVFIGPGDGRLYALGLADGELRWQLNRLADWQYLRQLHVSGEVLVAGTYKEKLVGLSVADGRVCWEFAAGNFINSQHVADGTAYLWSPTGWVYAIDTASGELRWRHRTTDYRQARGNWAPVLAELASVDGRLLVLDLAHTLHVLDCARGAALARYRSAEALQAFVTPRNAAEWYAANLRGEILSFPL